MPRKHPRPAAKKARAALRKKIKCKIEYDRLSAPFRGDPHFGDGLRLALIAARVLKEGP